jgi:hypothetical protein
MLDYLLDYALAGQEVWRICADTKMFFPVRRSHDVFIVVATVQADELQTPWRLRRLPV